MRYTQSCLPIRSDMKNLPTPSVQLFFDRSSSTLCNCGQIDLVRSHNSMGRVFLSNEISRPPHSSQIRIFNFYSQFYPFSHMMAFQFSRLEFCSSCSEKFATSQSSRNNDNGMSSARNNELTVFYWNSTSWKRFKDPQKKKWENRQKFESVFVNLSLAKTKSTLSFLATCAVLEELHTEIHFSSSGTISCQSLLL